MSDTSVSLSCLRLVVFVVVLFFLDLQFQQIYLGGKHLVLPRPPGIM